jgi:hypothetical protein
MQVQSVKEECKFQPLTRLRFVAHCNQYVNEADLIKCLPITVRT